MTMQLALKFRSHGGKRKGAGRKPKGDRPGVSHRARPELTKYEPVHVTLRVVRDLPNLRSRRAFGAVRTALIAGAERFGFRLIHFAVLSNHLHLICEADDREALFAGMKGLKVRLARAINRVAQRRGTVFTDRYHAQVLKTPTQTRNALLYVLNNFRRHSAQAGRRLAARFVDPCSSADVFDGWRERHAVPTLLATARSWLVRWGWRKRSGPLSISAVPG